MEISPDSQSRDQKVVRIGFRNILAILWVGTAGQIAWAVENSWFNTFVYDRITTSPRPIAWMVAVSAITAMLTTLLMGTLSDRTHGKWGRRKPYIVFGYIFWGIITAIYPMIEWIQNIGISVVFVVITDAVMTFFGSTSNDAAYNAWLKDVSQSSNRNRIQSINNIAGYLASAITFVAAGFIIDNYGYFVFFYALGGIVTVTGLISTILIPSIPAEKDSAKFKRSYAKELGDLLNPKILKENKILFLLFLNMALGGIASQVYSPYILIFWENYVGFSKTEMSIYLAVYIIAVILIYIIIGLISHKFNRKPLIFYGTLFKSFFTVGLGIASYFISYFMSVKIIVFVIYFLTTIPSVAVSIVHGGWLLDKYPEGTVGKFQGIRMIFMVLLPMVIGPPIGAWAIETWGIPTIDGFIPTPPIFIIGGLISILAVIPIIFIQRSEGRIHFN